MPSVRSIDHVVHWFRRRRFTRAMMGSMLALTSMPPAAPRSSLQNAANPLLGAWTLNRGRTHYGVGVDQRVRETFACEASVGGVTCTIQSVRRDSSRVAGRFTAALDGVARPVAGISGIDQMTLRLAPGGAADATFSYRGTAIYAYRAFRGDDGRSLSIVSVAPDSRAVLTTIVVYDRQ
jgi:hypothetical protein